jgi:phosphoribosylformylglycinamidine (FGAM) synthase PurS component
MTYTICFDLFIDDDNILSRKEIETLLKQLINNTSIEANNIRVIEVND